jgi:hypothetical protein
MRALPRKTLTTALSQLFHPFGRPTGGRPADITTTVREQMTDRTPRAVREHTHTTVVRHALAQRAGIPYEVEVRVCTVCRRVVDERPLHRAAA